MFCRVPLLLLVLGSIFPSAVVSQTFTNRSDLLQSSQETENFPLGASSIDYDRDGWMDIYQSHRLYRNNSGTGFIDEYLETGMDEGDVAFGAIFADYNADELMDVFFMDLDPPAHFQTRNADGQFVTINNTVGLEVAVAVQGSVWLDYDNDGLLDIYVSGDGEQDQLYRNINGLEFDLQSGALDVLIPRGVYGAAASDFDKDGDMDIYIGACRPNNVDESRNMMWVNNNGTFVEGQLGVEDIGDAWGVVWLDYDNDGWMDLYVVNYSNSGPERTGKNRLYRNLAERGFVEVSDFVGVGGGEFDQGFSASAADFNNDGWTDLYVLNNNAPDRLYINNRDRSFTDIFADSGIADLNNEGLAVTVADYDNDGSIDIFLGTRQGGQLYLNDGGENHWLKVGLQGVSSNRDGIGARLEIYQNGELAGMREITAGDGMTSQNHGLLAHFGLGEALDVDSLRVHWPSGTIDSIHDVAADQMLNITEGSFPVTRQVAEIPESIPVKAYPNPFFDFLDLQVDTGMDVLDVRVFDILGREVIQLPASGIGSTVIRWDGMDYTGATASPGVYFIRLTSGFRTTTFPVVKGVF